VRYEAEGLESLLDRRMERASRRAAPVDEAMAMQASYRERHLGWNVRHFHEGYRREGGRRSTRWVKNHLQAGGWVVKEEKKGTHRKKRERKSLPGRMIHQDGSRHEWVSGQQWDFSRDDGRRDP
jgi:hypothetical protein